MYGKLCQMDEISLIAKEHNLKIVEDCAQGHGAKLNGKLAEAGEIVTLLAFIRLKI